MKTLERPRKLANRGQRFRRRRRIAASILTLVALGTVAVCVYLLADFSPETVTETPLASRNESESSPENQPSDDSSDAPENVAPEKETKTPEPPTTLAGISYASVAAELPGSEADDVIFTQVSVLDPSWATVRLDTEDENESYYALFLERDQDDGWSVAKSVRIEDQDYPRDVKTLLTDVPKDLTKPILADDYPEPENEPQNRAAQFLSYTTGEADWSAVSSDSRGSVHDIEVQGPGAEPVTTHVYLRGSEGQLDIVAVGNDLTADEVPGAPTDMVEEASPVTVSAFEKSQTEAEVDSSLPEGGSREGLNKAVANIEDYPGVAGFYAYDLESGSGYGVRADEDFFSASTIKVAVMAAVYRKIEEGEMSYSDRITTTEEDWAAGAGWLRWETPGATSTVEDSLWLMMTQSDNVATNALTRLVGGPEYVNEVARDLGAKDTDLFWKLSSERGAVPSLENRSTPRDMATMLASIYEGERMSDYSRTEMVGLMEQNQLEYWMEAGVPAGIPVANKGGWLDSTYNDVGIVEYEERPYVLVTFTMYGEKMREGGELIADVSEDVWLAQTGMTKKEYEDREKDDSDVENRENGSDSRDPDPPENPDQPS